MDDPDAVAGHEYRLFEARVRLRSPPSLERRVVNRDEVTRLWRESPLGKPFAATHTATIPPQPKGCHVSTEPQEQ